ncbi:MAG: sigma-54 dependent transcriptional regulator [Phycisphaerales bacterium]|nr:sigma-54 dependent transcriptional regulator [Phycisphaerales bacterium]
MSEQLRAQVLIVEDDADHADVMAEALRKFGHVCTIVGGVERAVDELKHGTFDVLVTDLRMPASAGAAGADGSKAAADGGDAGLVVLRSARKLQPQAETIMVTAHGDVPTARAAFKEGAYDFIEKPLDLAVFRTLVNRAADTVLLRHEAAGGTGAASGAGLGDLVQHEGFEGIVAGSEPMRRILRTVKSVANTSLPVLIRGESGTGKELIAQAVHRLSPRAKGRFVAINCAAETQTLLEDQLFGHVRGAFTGAEKDREGVFEFANNGTLFLDEIGDMPLPMQAKLLRVLETGQVVRVGSNDPRQTDVRIVSATNKDLQGMIARGEFREDLFFRIKGAEVLLPPLRDRREDVPRIVNHALAKAMSRVSPGAPVPSITDAAMMRLAAYAWPGNVRELLNVVQNLIVAAIGEGGDVNSMTLDVRHIPDDVRAAGDEGAGDDDGGQGPSGPGASLAGTPLEQLEKRAIRETLRLAAGNREAAAKLLGIGERTLYRKLKEYGLR